MVTAIRYTAETCAQLCDTWLSDPHTPDDDCGNVVLLIPTRSGHLKDCAPGEWVVRDAAGNLSVWKHKRFKAAFEAVSDE
jgi:hypothetical protein